MWGDKMKKGDMVKTIYGEIETVLKVTDCAIYFYDCSVTHPTKCWMVMK